MTYREGGECEGFVLRQVAPLAELNATLLRWEHRRTGARWLHLATADDNNLFAVGFRTPPRDSTGVAHILEHTVLCGSRRYPVRDPFFAMIRRSLNTFMNALTASDWTLYPFSSQNRTDFYNLLGVYLDAAFFPLLRERDFRQEGWRLEFQDPSDPSSPLGFKGVVYNEMRGAMADPHSLLSQRVAEALYPTATYGRNAGGEPARIPDLTWEGLRAFHAACYHPSNAYFVTYGDLPVEEHLAAAERLALAAFGPSEPDTAVGAEARFPEPRRVEAGYPVAPGEPLDGRSMVQLAWLNGPVTDSFGRLAMDLLSSLLLGTPAAPLHKALLDSKLGANLAPGCGYNGENLETCFEAGLQGTDPEKAGAVEDLVLSTLERLARDGFSRDRVEAAVHRLEFAHREVKGDHYPYALSLVSRLMGPWIHGGDPVAALSLTADLERLRRELDAGPFFQDLLRRELLDNPHRVTLTLRPDPAAAERDERELQERLGALREALMPEAAEALAAQALELQAAQEAVEDLSCLPSLGVEDVPPAERPVAGSEAPVGGVPVSWFDQPTNGIAYFTAYLEAADVPADLLPLVPLFCSLLTQVGAAGLSHVEMAERAEASTGGVWASAALLESPGAHGEFRPLVAVQSKALHRNHQKMFGVVADYLAAPDFTDLDRIRTVLGQLRTNLDNSIPSVGHRYASRAAAAGLTPSGRRRELWGGVEHVRLVRRLAGLDEGGLGGLAAELGRLAELLLTRGRARCAVVSEAAAFPAVRPPLEGLLARLPEGGGAPAGAGGAFAPAPVRRGLAASVPVNYAARVFPCAPYTHPDAGGLLVLAKLLRSGYLHREIREKGGAYGGMCSYDAEGGLLAMLSYRDPHLARTLGVFDEAARWAAGGDFGADDVKEAILGVFADLDRPLSPGGKGEREFANREQGLTPAMRQRLRDDARAAERDLLADLARRYLVEGRPRSSVAAVASEEALQQANGELGEEALAIEKL